MTAFQQFLAPRPIGETAGGNGDGGIQLRLDSGDASSSAGERLAAATAGRRWLLTTMGFKFVCLQLGSFRTLAFLFVYIHSLRPHIDRIFSLIFNIIFAVIGQ